MLWGADISIMSIFLVIIYNWSARKWFFFNSMIIICGMVAGNTIQKWTTCPVAESYKKTHMHDMTQPDQVEWYACIKNRTVISMCILTAAMALILYLIIFVKFDPIDDDLLIYEQAFHMTSKFGNSFKKLVRVSTLRQEYFATKIEGYYNQRD